MGNGEVNDKGGNKKGVMEGRLERREVGGGKEEV